MSDRPNTDQEVSGGVSNPAWHNNGSPGLEDTIAELKAKLPGWYYTVCECQVSCDARVAPTTESPHVRFAEHGNPFDEGFDVALPQPCTLADALRFVMREAPAAVAEREAA